MAADSPCGDWEPYKDEKCFKIIDETLRAHADAEKSCSQLENSSTLLIIRFKDEQDFLSNFLFKTNKKVDNVWIGAKFTTNKFKWSDDSDLSFTNWGEGSPRNKTNYCVQMQSDEALVGKWIDEPCEKKDLVVCQKMQTWSLSRLQKTLLDARKELRDALNNLQQNPVPIGFIYIQLASQPEPKTLWPTVEWKDATSDYAGLFFRAEGGGSAAFGTLQNENTPYKYIDIVENYLGSDKCDGYKGYSLSSYGWSPWFLSGASTGTCMSLRFHVSGNDGEVRPSNKAVRIWKRTN